MAKLIKAIFLLLALALLVSIPSVVSAQEEPVHCSMSTDRVGEDGKVIYHSNPGLVRDCETLLEARGALGSTVPLGWSAEVSMHVWHYVEFNNRYPNGISQLFLDPTIKDPHGEFIFRGTLTGRIPASLGRLSKLEYLMLSNNQLTGRVPVSLGNLSQLGGLELQNNQLSGEIPPELGNLSRLWGLNLAGNALSGPIPPELGNLANLDWLKLDQNQLSGPIPPELGNLVDLEFLYLHENQLSGEIPPELGNLVNLVFLGLGGNQLTGCVPSSLEDQLRMDRSDLGGLPFCSN